MGLSLVPLRSSASLCLNMWPELRYCKGHLYNLGCDIKEMSVFVNVNVKLAQNRSNSEFPQDGCCFLSQDPPSAGKTNTDRHNKGGNDCCYGDCRDEF